MTTPSRIHTNPSKANAWSEGCSPAQVDQRSLSHASFEPGLPLPRTTGGLISASAAPTPKRPSACGPPLSVNQRLPSELVRIPPGREVDGSAKFVITPDGVTRPIARVGPRSVNQRFPSAPGVISIGLEPGFRPAERSVIVPAGVIVPIALVVPWSVNHTLPSRLGDTAAGSEPGLRPALNSVIVP